MACPEGRTADGFEAQFGLFTSSKLTILASATPELPSRAIFLASVAHRFAEPNFDNLNLDGAYVDFITYGASKTSNLWAANEIDRRYRAKGYILLAFNLEVLRRIR